MAVRSKPADEVKVLEFFCESCNVGRYRSTGHFSVAGGHKQFEHRCNHCQDEAVFSVIYPMLEYQGRRFMLDDALRFNMGTGEIPQA